MIGAGEHVDTTQYTMNTAGFASSIGPYLLLLGQYQHVYAPNLGHYMPVASCTAPDMYYRC